MRAPKRSCSCIGGSKRGLGRRTALARRWPYVHACWERWGPNLVGHGNEGEVVVNDVVVTLFCPDGKARHGGVVDLHACAAELCAADPGHRGT